MLLWAHRASVVSNLFPIQWQWGALGNLERRMGVSLFVLGAVGMGGSSTSNLPVPMDGVMPLMGDARTLETGGLARKPGS